MCDFSYFMFFFVYVRFPCLVFVLGLNYFDSLYKICSLDYPSVNYMATRILFLSLPTDFWILMKISQILCHDAVVTCIRTKVNKTTCFKKRAAILSICFFLTTALKWYKLLTFTTYHPTLHIPFCPYHYSPLKNQNLP